jgi:hypothetical protein
MTARSRYVVIASILVLIVGIATALVAYYVGVPGGGSRGNRLAELRYLPRDASVVAYADVRQVMTSELHAKLRQAMPAQENGPRDFEKLTGINIQTDIDRVVACLSAGRDGATEGDSLVVARGRFDEDKIEALMRDHGARIEVHAGKRLIVADQPHNRVAVAFLEPGLVAVGGVPMVQGAVDRHMGGDNVTDNVELMDRVRSLDGSAWAVGRFDALGSRARLPPNLASQLPAITWFSASARVDGGLSAVVRADTRDDEAANGLRETVRGLLTFAKLQGVSQPPLQAIVESLQLGGTGKTVMLTVSVPRDVFDAIAR